VVAILPRVEDPRIPIARVAAVRAPLLVDSPQGTGSPRLRPVDPATLADVAGLVPIELGHQYSHALNPDGRTLAVIVWPSGSNNRGGSLHLIDLATWTVHETSVTIDDDVLGPAYSPAGGSLW
jgi:hypothetical protein